MKKIIIFYLSLISLSFGEISDVSFVLKGGFTPLGFYEQSVKDDTTKTTTKDKTTMSNGLNVNLEFQSRSKTFDNFYYGVGLGYLQSPSLKDEIGGISELGVDYFPVYFLLQYEPESEYYFEFLMYFSMRAGISYERDIGRLKESTSFGNIFSTPSPYLGFSWGFEKENLMVEAFYDFNVGASANLTPIGDYITMNSRRIGLSVGMRLNASDR